MLPNTTVFNSKNILVTGASGFMGAELIRSINRFSPSTNIFATAKAVDMKRPLYGQLTEANLPIFTMVEKIIDCDLRNRDDVIHAVAVADPDIVIHLGALTQVTEAKAQFYNTMMTNAIGTLNVLEACHVVRPHEIKIVVSTTDKVYGSWNNPVPFKTTDRLCPSHPYDVSKACADIIAQGFGEYFEERIFIARFANVFGPGDTNFKRLIPDLIRKGLTRTKPIIRSDGKQVRQYIFIDDVIYALIHAVNHLYKVPPGRGEIFNFSGFEKPFSVMEVFDLVKKVLGIKGYQLDDPTVLNKATDESSQLSIDTTKAYEVLSWWPRLTFEMGLGYTVDWLKEYLQRERIRYD